MVGKGEVLAKASELGPHLTVVFPDDFVGSAQVIATDWTRDLALVRVPADYTDRARSLDWEAARDATIGTLVAAVTPEGHEPEVGVICGPSLPLPAVPGMLPVRVVDAAEGAKVTEVFPQLCSLRLENVFPLKVGDVITRVGGMAIKDGSAFQVLFDGPSIGQVSRVSGNPVTIHYLRAGRRRTRRCRWSTSAYRPSASAPTAIDSQGSRPSFPATWHQAARRTAVLPLWIPRDSSSVC